MADAKYIARQVALKQDLLDKLEAVRARVSADIGVRLSLSETIAYLVHQHEKASKETH